MTNHKFFYFLLLIISSIYTQTIFHKNIDQLMSDQEIIIEALIDVNYSNIKKVI
mgnify:FL=1